MSTIYRQTFFTFSQANTEALIASDSTPSAKHIIVQANTNYDCNVLLFQDPGGNTKPTELAVRAGGAISVAHDFEYFAIYTAQTEPQGDAIPPAGKGGTYDGPGQAPGNAVGYVSVVAYDVPMPMFSSGDPVTANASLTGPLPAGTNNIGHVDVDVLPALPAGTNNIGHVDVDVLPALPAGANNIGHVNVDAIPDSNPVGFTWMKVTAAAAGIQVVKNAPGKLAALVADSGNAGVNITLQDGATQAWNQGNYTGPFPITCATSIQVNFSAAGSAWVLYK